MTYETKKATHDVRTIAQVEGGVVKAGKEVEWKEQIIIPPLPQSSLAGCELIKIEYHIKVRYALLQVLSSKLVIFVVFLIAGQQGHWKTSCGGLSSVVIIYHCSCFHSYTSLCRVVWLLSAPYRLASHLLVKSLLISCAHLF